ncbi:unnamed protein product [Enterobius vermicularis]|uniref:Pepsin-I3 domain-containing protein n=1 Tax=Enterobius vermicularis TaxID=51028 RepID=A0A0N4VFJ2_ENTVE|nr:unnamed protein product [Enterobius vermicularis]
MSILIKPPDALTISGSHRYSSLCVVSGNMLFANSYFVRELTKDEADELADYEEAINEYNKMLHEHITGATKSPTEWIFGGRFILPFEQRTMPRRPAAPSFCTGPDTVIHQLDGCIVQNYRVYIGPLYVRQLNDNEKAELDEYDIKVKEYKEKAIENMKRQLGTMISGVWYPYDRGIIRHRQILLGGIQEGSVNSNNSSTVTSNENSTTEPNTPSTTTITPPPQPPRPPKLCTQIF